jgi:hypothetical protein
MCSIESVATFPFDSKAIIIVQVQNFGKVVEVVDLAQKWNKHRWPNSKHVGF